AVAVVMIGALTGCAEGATVVADEVRGEQRSVQIGELSAADLGTAQRAFGLDLLHASCAERPGENLLISPTSAAEALGMLYPAADDAAAQHLGTMLHLPEWSPDLIAATQAHTGDLADLAFAGDPSS